MSANKMKLYSEQYNEITRKVFGEYVIGDSKENVVISPLSIIVLMAIAADATDCETRAEFTRMLKGELPQETAIKLIAYIQRELTKDNSLISSNAVIVNKEIEDSINPDYREQLESRFGGELFCTKRIVDEVNAWVKKKTNGMIDRIANETMSDMLAALINAVAFQAEWSDEYEDDQIEDGEFTNADGSTSEVTMLYSEEGYYIENEFFTGFRKPYKGNQYSFMALLPKEPQNDRFFRKAIEKIDFTRIFESARLKDVHVSMPEFTTEFGTDLKGLFMNMGIKEIFSDRADFSPLSGAWLKADSIIHKAKIEVDRKGTKAAAVTAMFEYAAGIPSFEYKVVDLDRPFVYAIVHNETGLPVFTGVVNEIR